MFVHLSTSKSSAPNYRHEFRAQVLIPSYSQQQQPPNYRARLTDDCWQHAKVRAKVKAVRVGVKALVFSQCSLILLYDVVPINILNNDY